jgi:RING finger family protein
MTVIGDLCRTHNRHRRHHDRRLSAEVAGLAEDSDSKSEDERANLDEDFGSTLVVAGSALIGDKCLICLVEYEVGSSVTFTACAHKFHEHCFSDFITHANDGTCRSVCPACQLPL